MSKVASTDWPVVLLVQPIIPQPKDHAGLANTDLSTKLRAFFRSAAHADIQLRAGSEVFPAHKIVLAAQSPTFERMFEAGMVEQVILPSLCNGCVQTSGGCQTACWGTM